jgi:hypothetical protein
MPGLSALKVKTAKLVRHGDGAGLYLLVSQSGAKSWMIRVQRDGKRRDIGLGSLSDLTLEEAREKARGLRNVARTGGDPIAARDKRDEARPSLAVAPIEPEALPSLAVVGGPPSTRLTMLLRLRGRDRRRLGLYVPGT